LTTRTQGAQDAGASTTAAAALQAARAQLEAAKAAHTAELRAKDAALADARSKVLLTAIYAPTVAC
jgi:hypothetical protein